MNTRPKWPTAGIPEPEEVCDDCGGFAVAEARLPFKDGPDVENWFKVCFMCKAKRLASRDMVITRRLPDGTLIARS